MVAPVVAGAIASGAAASAPGWLSSLGGLAGLGNAASGFGSLLGGLGGLFGGSDDAEDAADNAWWRNWNAQKKVAQNSVQWRVDDARKAGIHPALALGMNPASFSPSYSVGGGDGGNILTDLADMGQGVGRALAAMGTKEERVMTRASARLALENQQLENDMLRSEIALKRAQLAPPFPSGSTTGDLLEVVPTRTSPGGGGNDQFGTSSRPFHQWLTGPSGRRILAPSDDWLMMMENNPVMIPQWIGEAIRGGVENSGRAIGRRIRQFFSGD